MCACVVLVKPPNKPHQKEGKREPKMIESDIKDIKDIKNNYRKREILRE